MLIKQPLTEAREAQKEREFSTFIANDEVRGHTDPPEEGTEENLGIMKAKGGKRTRDSATDNVTILSSTEDDDYRHKEICGRYIPCSRQPVTRQTTPNSGPFCPLPPVSKCSQRVPLACCCWRIAAGYRWWAANWIILSTLRYRIGYKITRPRTHRKSDVLTFAFEISGRNFVTTRSRLVPFEGIELFCGTYSERGVNFSWVISHVTREISTAFRDILGLTSVWKIMYLSFLAFSSTLKLHGERYFYYNA